MARPQCRRYQAGWKHNPMRCCLIDTDGRNNHSWRRKGWLGCALLAASLPAFGQDAWTLPNAIRRALDVAPELRIAEAEVSAREAVMRQAGAWPNPDIELRADNKIGKESGDGGTDFTQLSLSQSLPLFSGKRQHAQHTTESEWQATQFDRQREVLAVEADTARIFHGLQRIQAQWQLAQQRLELADTLQQAAQRRKQAGEISHLEQLRLDILREQAHQAIDREEGELSEAYTRFRTRLDLPALPAATLVALTPVTPPPTLADLQASIREHPGVRSAVLRTTAAYSSVAVARAERIPDPVLRLFRERDFINDRVQDVTGVGVGISIPLWDRNHGRIQEAQARVTTASVEATTSERMLRAELEQSHAHLGHLLQQASHFQERVLQPAREVLNLTRKAYAAGEAEILALIDANDTYFDAQGRYLELLHDAWVEAAQLRLAAGRSLLDEEK